MATQGRSDVHRFDSTMTGATSLDYNVGSLIAVVKSCLITGFGSEAPQGSWEVVYEVTGRAAFRSTDPDSTGMCLYIDDSLVGSKTYARVNGYESMADIDTGTNIFGTYSGSPLFWMKTNNSTGTRPWTLIANNSAFYLFVRWDNNASRTSFNEGCFFGDVLSVLSTDLYRCAIIGSTIELPYPGGNGAYQTNFYNLTIDSATSISISNGSAVARNYLGTVGQMLFYKTAQGLANGTNAAMGGAASINTTYPDPVTGTARISPIGVCERNPGDSNFPGWFRGEMPGMYAPLHRLNPPGETLVTEAPDAHNHDVLFFKMGYGASTDIARVGIDITGPWELSIPHYRNRGALGISGVVKELSVPGAYRVLLYRQSDGALARETWSASDGTYSFSDLKLDLYMVVAVDHTDPLRSPAIQTDVVPS